MREAGAALDIAKRIPTDVFVVHLGTPTAQGGENSRAAAFRSIEEICAIAEPIGVRVAVELIPNEISDAQSLVTLLDRDLDGARAGICLDFGHAFLMGDVAGRDRDGGRAFDHDARARQPSASSDDHLVPFDGGIDWNAALMSMQKIGYDGTYLMEVANTGAPADVLDGARRARQTKFEVSSWLRT